VVAASVACSEDDLHADAFELERALVREVLLCDLVRASFIGERWSGLGRDGIRRAFCGSLTNQSTERSAD